MQKFRSKPILFPSDLALIVMTFKSSPVLEGKGGSGEVAGHM